LPLYPVRPSSPTRRSSVLRCKLDVSGRLGGPMVHNGQVVEIAPMTALLPYDADLEPDDALTINDRAMRVIDVRRGGEWGLFTSADRKSTRLNSSHVKISYA